MIQKYSAFAPIVAEAINVGEFSADLKYNILKVCKDEKVRAAIAADNILPENSL